MELGGVHHVAGAHVRMEAEGSEIGNMFFVIGETDFFRRNQVYYLYKCLFVKLESYLTKK